MALDLTTRHDATRRLLHFFRSDHLPSHLAGVSDPCGALALHMVEILPDGAELTTALRKLLEAKDCFVRAALQ